MIMKTGFWVDIFRGSVLLAICCKIVFVVVGSVNQFNSYVLPLQGYRLRGEHKTTGRFNRKSPKVMLHRQSCSSRNPFSGKTGGLTIVSQYDPGLQMRLVRLMSSKECDLIAPLTQPSIKAYADGEQHGSRYFQVSNMQKHIYVGPRKYRPWLLKSEGHGRDAADHLLVVR